MITRKMEDAQINHDGCDDTPECYYGNLCDRVKHHRLRCAANFIRLDSLNGELKQAIDRLVLIAEGESNNERTS